ncbi:hypothetical protein [Methylobacterium ajmalii]|uniref:hypothetical protein n=1 Tax=Methylobacterium ajmalii TaxID=2738439 RepID=UPI002F351D34
MTKKIAAPKFTAAQFTPTQWDTSEVKAKFANKLARFIINDFPETSFDNRFYQRLSMTFGHIAHYNRAGFYDAQFSDTRAKLSFIKQLVGYPCYGSPAFTYSDVEHEVRAWLLTSGVPARIEAQLAAEVAAAERAQLQRLMAKHPDVRAA